MGQEGGEGGELRPQDLTLIGARFSVSLACPWATGPRDLIALKMKGLDMASDAAPATSLRLGSILGA